MQSKQYFTKIKNYPHEKSTEPFLYFIQSDICFILLKIVDYQPTPPCKIIIFQLIIFPADQLCLLHTLQNILLIILVVIIIQFQTFCNSHQPSVTRFLAPHEQSITHIQSNGRVQIRLTFFIICHQYAVVFHSNLILPFAATAT